MKTKQQTESHDLTFLALLGLRHDMKEAAELNARIEIQVEALAKRYGVE